VLAEARHLPRRAPLAIALLTCLGLLPTSSRGQTPPEPPATLDDTLEAGDADMPEPRRKLVAWNEYEGPYLTLRVGGGVLYEGAAYAQDAESEQQFDLEPEARFRDARFLLKGSFPKFDRAVTWSTGIMYDGPTDSWLLRETGVMVDVPELWGQIFVGRTKEGFSLNKVMSGYSGWTMERSTISDAAIPILADGVKWLGYLPNRGILWNLGIYGDWLSEGQSFSSYHRQYVARLIWLPIRSEAERTLLHLGVNFRYGEVADGELKLRSRPEAFPAPYFVDTGAFPADHTDMASVEAYYRPRNWLFGGEYFVQKADSPTMGDPVSHGGDVVISWLATGEVRTYNTRGAYFNAISPDRTVFEKGPGAWELVARFSYIDLDSGPVHGGKFWRFTPMANWHLSDNLRLSIVYGYGHLERFELAGVTQFFQSRLQFVF
jgi:phosphate-selective porin OprO and OprP